MTTEQIKRGIIRLSIDLGCSDEETLELLKENDIGIPEMEKDHE